MKGNGDFIVNDITHKQLSKVDRLSFVPFKVIDYYKNLHNMHRTWKKKNVGSYFQSSSYKAQYNINQKALYLCSLRTAVRRLCLNKTYSIRDQTFIFVTVLRVKYIGWQLIQKELSIFNFRMLIYMSVNTVVFL